MFILYYININYGFGVYYKKLHLKSYNQSGVSYFFYFCQLKRCIAVLEG